MILHRYTYTILYSLIQCISIKQYIHSIQSGGYKNPPDTKLPSLISFITKRRHFNVMHLINIYETTVLNYYQFAFILFVILSDVMNLLNVH